MKRKNFLAAFLSFSLSMSGLFAFTQQDIISPVPGTWANKQPLVLLNDGCDIYYSLSNSDPLVSGFSYDGPVLIDAEGSVNLRITAVDSTGVRSDYSVRYTVEEFPLSLEESEITSFIRNINMYPVKTYFSGNDFVIPEEFDYSLSNSRLPYMKGQVLKLNSRNSLPRVLPVSVGLNGKYWHFVIMVRTNLPKNLLEKSVPFTVTDWEVFEFTGENLIYRIDEEFWNASKEPVLLDRSVPHRIQWQSIFYHQDNPIGETILPSKPSLAARSGEEGTEFYIPANSKFRIADGTYCAPSVVFDVFSGESVEGNVEFPVYYDEVFQGNLSTYFVLDKEPPVPPVIKSSADVSYSRSKVSLNITGDAGDRIFYSVSQPVVSTKGFYDTDLSGLEVRMNEFEEYSSGEILLGSGEYSCFYRILAYSQDDHGNRSSMSEYSVVVDEYNYYLDTCLKPEDSRQNGSYGSPFTSFEQIIPVINSRKFTRVFVNGDVKISSDLLFTGSCDFVCKNTTFSISENSTIKVDGVKLAFENAILRKDQGSQMFTLFSNSGIKFSGCEVIALYDQDGIMIKASGSSVTAENTGFTLQTGSYGCLFSLQDCNTSMLQCRFSTVSSACVNMSIHGGQVDLRQNSFSVSGTLGRNLELMETTASLRNNTFNCSLKGVDKKNGTAVYKDRKTVFQELSGNETF